MNLNKTGADGTIGLALGERIKFVTRASVDGDGDPAQDAHKSAERDGYEVRMQEMEARVNILSHGQSTKDVLSDVIHVWLVLQRSGL